MTESEIMQYADEFGAVEQHERLLKRRVESPAAVVVSGYAHPLYDDMLVGWHRHVFGAKAMSGDRRSEVLWSNREAAQEPFDFGEGSA